MLSKEEIKKWSNEQKVEALAKFVALRSLGPNKALLYGYMLDDLLDEINKKQRKINKLETNNKKLIQKLEKILEKYEHEIASEESAINLYTEIKEIVKGVNNVK